MIFFSVTKNLLARKVLPCWEECGLGIESYRYRCIPEWDQWPSVPTPFAGTLVNNARFNNLHHPFNSKECTALYKFNYIMMAEFISEEYVTLVKNAFTSNLAMSLPLNRDGLDDSEHHTVFFRVLLSEKIST